MRDLSQKDLAVFDFSAEEEAVEAAVARYTARFHSRLRSKMDDEVNKYRYLQACKHLIHLLFFLNLKIRYLV